LIVDDGGSVTILPGRRLTTSTITLGSNSSITFSAATTGFTTQRVTGNAILAGGNAIIELGAYIANQTVALLTVDGVISGSFSLVPHNSLLFFFC
jgi:hypothetical protein